MSFGSQNVQIWWRNANIVGADVDQDGADGSAVVENADSADVDKGPAQDFMFASRDSSTICHAPSPRTSVNFRCAIASAFYSSWLFLGWFCTLYETQVW